MRTKPLFPEPARYFPLHSGRFAIKAGLYALGTGFGNGPADHHIFQFDRHCTHYLESKTRARREEPGKYVCEDDPGKGVLQALATLMVQTLPREHPELFRVETATTGDSLLLHCAPSGQVLHLDQEMNLLDVLPSSRQPSMPDPPYTSVLDALACQVQEDIAITEIDETGNDRLSALHLCFPNHWAASDKIGQCFARIHEPVPGIDRISRKAAPLLQRLVSSGPYVRFAWGLSTDKRLNHHPVAPAGTGQDTCWRGRQFDPRNPELYVRVERQVIHGLPGSRAFLFTIRTYFVTVDTLEGGKIERLAAAIRTMDPETREYKGIAGQSGNILEWLDSLVAEKNTENGTIPHDSITGEINV